MVQPDDFVQSKYDFLYYNITFKMTYQMKKRMKKSFGLLIPKPVSCFIHRQYWILFLQQSVYVD